MTTDLSLTNLFEGKPIRFVTEDGRTFTPIMDIARATGVNKRTLLTILDRNKDDFASHERTLQMSTPGGNQPIRCIDHDGATNLLLTVSTGHVKRENIKLRLKQFREWQITKVNQTIVLPAPEKKGPDYPGIIQKLKFIRSVHEETGWNLLELQKEVLREAGMISLTYHIEPEKPVALPAPPKPKDYLTATDIGERIGKSAEEVHIWMSNRKPPLIIRDDVSGWRLTTWGKDFAEERAVELVGGTVVWRIKWKKDILRLFNIRDEHYEVG